jgi:hypothetical protein
MTERGDGIHQVDFQTRVTGIQNVTTLILNKYHQSSNSSVSGFQVQDSMTTQNAYC